jgi:hypothetical protein
VYTPSFTLWTTMVDFPQFIRPSLMMSIPESLDVRVQMSNSEMRRLIHAWRPKGRKTLPDGVMTWRHGHGLECHDYLPFSVIDYALMDGISWVVTPLSWSETTGVDGSRGQGDAHDPFSYPSEENFGEGHVSLHKVIVQNRSTICNTSSLWVSRPFDM